MSSIIVLNVIITNQIVIIVINSNSLVISLSIPIYGLFLHVMKLRVLRIVVISTRRLRLLISRSVIIDWSDYYTRFFERIAYFILIFVHIKLYLLLHLLYSKTTL